MNIFKRKPDFIIGGKENPYLLRWWIIPRNRFFNIYLHKFLRDDDDRALHDHPWWSCSIVLWGGYIEHTPDAQLQRRMGGIYFRKATARHRIELYRDFDCAHCNCVHRKVSFKDKTKTRKAWTLFITGPRIREWGFWCEGTRFVPWYIFCDDQDSGKVGKGCQ